MVHGTGECLEIEARYVGDVNETQVGHGTAPKEAQGIQTQQIAQREPARADAIGADVLRVEVECFIAICAAHVAPVEVKAYVQILVVTSA